MLTILCTEILIDMDLSCTGIIYFIFLHLEFKRTDALSLEHNQYSRQVEFHAKLNVRQDTQEKRCQILTVYPFDSTSMRVSRTSQGSYNFRLADPNLIHIL